MRAQALAALRGHLQGQGLVEVDAPVLLPHAGSEPHLLPLGLEPPGLPGRLWLQTSPELPLKRLLCAGVPALFSLGPAFRGGREELSALHQPEFTLLEWYRPGEALADLEQDVRARGAAAARALGRPEPGPGRSLDLAEACARWAGIDIEPLLDGDGPRFAHAARAAGLMGCRSDDDPVTLLSRVLVERLDPALREQEGWVFLHGWPACVAALARLDPADPRRALRVEAYLDGLEIANGYVELTDPDEMVRRRARDDALREGPAIPDDAALLAALRASPPGATVGMALGVDRLLLALTGGRSLEEVRPLSLRLARAGRDPRPRR